MSVGESCFIWLHRRECLYMCKKHQTHKHAFAPTYTESQTPSDSSICSPYPLESAPETKRRRDRLRVLSQPFSLLDNLITSDRGDAARSAPVQGHSPLGPRLRRCAQRRGGEQRAPRPVRRDLIPEPRAPSDYSIIHL